MAGTRREPLDEVTVLGEGSALTGNLKTRGSVQIDGAISGALSTAGTLSIGPRGRILGEVHAAKLSVRGKIHGIVFVRDHLQVHASGVVRGHARYATLEIERGGVMDGSATLMVADEAAAERQAAE